MTSIIYQPEGKSALAWICWQVRHSTLIAHPVLVFVAPSSPSLILTLFLPQVYINTLSSYSNKLRLQAELACSISCNPICYYFAPPTREKRNRSSCSGCQTKTTHGVSSLKRDKFLSWHCRLQKNYVGVALWECPGTKTFFCWRFH